MSATIVASAVTRLSPMILLISSRTDSGVSKTAVSMALMETETASSGHSPLAAILTVSAVAPSMAISLSAFVTALRRSAFRFILSMVNTDSGAVNVTLNLPSAPSATSIAVMPFAMAMVPSEPASWASVVAAKVLE